MPVATSLLSASRTHLCPVRHTTTLAFAPAASGSPICDSALASLSMSRQQRRSLPVLKSWPSLLFSPPPCAGKDGKRKLLQRVGTLLHRAQRLERQVKVFRSVLEYWEDRVRRTDRNFDNVVFAKQKLATALTHLCQGPKGTAEAVAEARALFAAVVSKLGSTRGEDSPDYLLAMNSQAVLLMVDSQSYNGGIGARRRRRPQGAPHTLTLQPLTPAGLAAYSSPPLRTRLFARNPPQRHSTRPSPFSPASRPTGSASFQAATPSCAPPCTTSARASRCTRTTPCTRNACGAP